MDNNKKEKINLSLFSKEKRFQHKLNSIEYIECIKGINKERTFYDEESFYQSVEYNTLIYDINVDIFFKFLEWYRLSDLDFDLEEKGNYLLETEEKIYQELKKVL